MLARLLSPLVRPMLERGKAMRRSQFEELGTPPGRVLLLGDSITEAGLWHEWITEWPVLNRGISGDTVAGVHQRIRECINEPLAISVLIGTNDLSQLGRSHSVSSIVSAMKDLVHDIRDLAPDAPLIVNSVMPRAVAFGSQLQDLNEGYRETSAEAGATYLDLWPSFADDRGALHESFTADALHLTGKGYRAWVAALRPALARAMGATQLAAGGDNRG